MIIFLYGSDGYRLKQNRDRVEDSYRKKYQSGLNIFNFDFSDKENTSVLEDALKSVSFFNELKLITGSGFFANKNLSAELLGILRKHEIADSKDIVLLISENMSGKDLSEKNSKLFDLLLNKENTVKSFEPLTGSKLHDWIENEFQTRGKHISPEGKNKLIELTGNDSWQLMNEVEKLANYTKQEEVGEKDVTNLIVPKIDMNIFDLIDAIAARDKVLALGLLYKELWTGRDPYYILSMIVYQFRNIITVKDIASRNVPLNSLISKSGVHPYVANKIKKNISKFDTQELVKIYGKLLEMDTRSKQGTVNLEDSLSKFILTIA
ncbi:MAG: DNA polymerase III subunit delta [Candidatus Yanofskybacteria bacterium RIFCSPHIGHO2_02_FULL_44_12b]|uniref:DNA polymerase III subunit delta n=2 Tax=Candidatus Yanofskyibacteriota TaxID=1752733 RepID=A0A1F8GMH7_9BACT|nr:MAG: polymerase III, delta subunit protein [Candidatus Yanofskybacteria bacterium GW2011_GWA2_44_9]OGN05522.1 MAG: DNA polymerase III subunit delta [Candidatus Yanofskybacteria bacterium RIFCSPHIGHO2_01_FULL_44_24]OGN15072.1 MAG: DNA polymerase III subunit delta [Candidatus Yanofskybacteria bacterium RIFCSPHIGHO2_02_FULL_44_12b]OGN26541.1 MAG: DNA polymerase III subunit delta [Candidatus Yanofskybacteria bacterium RIFCSPLOWO2_01_FULL_44_22]